MADLTAAELRSSLIGNRKLGMHYVLLYEDQVGRCARALEDAERVKVLERRISDLMEAMAPFANRQAEMERNRQTGETRYSHIREKQWKCALEVYTASSDEPAARGQK